MRYVFFIVIILLLELFSLGAALSLQWWIAPWTKLASQTMAMIVVFLISNGLLLLSVSKLLKNSYRWVSGWMLAMHFMVLTAAIIILIYGAGWVTMTMFDSATIFAMPAISVALGLRGVALLVFIGLFVYALYSAYIPKVRHLTVTINKPLLKPLRIAVASDLHLGRLFGNKAIDRLQRLITQSQADMLLMPGDIMDDNTQAFSDYNMAANLVRLCASLPYGVYATLGNHDLYGHEKPITESLRNAGVQLLNDEVLRLDYKGQPVWLVGRFDNHKRQRMATTELLAQVNTEEPVILLDHRPSDIIEHSLLPIDLQLSGHTHNGQIFPANFIVSSINRLGYGYEAIGKGHFVVSSGYGFWGIPFRLGSRSEIWLISLSGQ
ncbi:metallophosphoesterase [Psychrobacter sp. BF1]|uniref:metallophosphoesterase n=1 Tax=Psychrobacter sp. BF1 TaxID=2821147 RepID=UPI001C4DE0A8|nr:metallophosphoesterase [Psychrobacter sp. BF1]